MNNLTRSLSIASALTMLSLIMGSAPISNPLAPPTKSNTFAFQRAMTVPATEELAVALSFIMQQKYDDAINRLEQIHSKNPHLSEAITYLATARMYRDRDFLKAQKEFEEAIQQGGGATFLVNHSHEITKMSVDDLADYCRGWLHLRKQGLRFEPLEEGHRLNANYGEVLEIKQNQNRKLFHFKLEKANYNFMPRSRVELETLLAIVMYKKLATVK